MANGTTDYKLGELTAAVKGLHEEIKNSNLITKAEIALMRNDIKELRKVSTKNSLNLVKVAVVAIMSGGAGSAIIQGIL